MRPPSARPNFVDVSTVEKYTMPEEKYEELTDTVLSWKKRQQLGRFDPNKPNVEAEKSRKMQEEIEARGIVIGKRCRVGGAELNRRGTVRYVGPVEQIPGEGLWVGMLPLSCTSIVFQLHNCCTFAPNLPVHWGFTLGVVTAPNLI